MSFYFLFHGDNVCKSDKHFYTLAPQDLKKCSDEQDTRNNGPLGPLIVRKGSFTSWFVYCQGRMDLIPIIV